MAGSVRVTMTVNGAQESAEVEPRLLLVHFLRETLGLTGTLVTMAYHAAFAEIIWAVAKRTAARI